MAAVDYAGWAQDIAVLLADCGQTVTLVDRDEIETTATAVILDYGSRERDGELVLPNDRRAYVVPIEGVVPDPEEHFLRVGTDDYRIVSVRTVAPEGTTLYHDCQIRH